MRRGGASTRPRAGSAGQDDEEGGKAVTRGERSKSGQDAALRGRSPWGAAEYETSRAVGGFLLPRRRFSREKEKEQETHGAAVRGARSGSESSESDTTSDTKSPTSVPKLSLPKTRTERARSTVMEVIGPAVEWLRSPREHQQHQQQQQQQQCWLNAVPDETLLARILPLLPVADLARVLLVCKRLSGLVLALLQPHLKQENRLVALNDVRRLKLFVEQLTACRGLDFGVTVADYDSHPLWSTARSRFRLLLCQSDSSAGRMGAVTQLGELRLLHGRFWYRAILATADLKRLIVSAPLTRVQARSILAVVVSKSRGDHVVTYAPLRRDRFKLPDPIFGENEIVELAEDDHDADTLELDDEVAVDVKMGV